jgi:hypothetical protein
MDSVDRAAHRLAAVEGIDGRPLIQTEGIDPADADAWLEDAMKLMQSIPVWRNTHVLRYGVGSRSATTWDVPEDSDTDQEDSDGWDEKEDE